MHMNNPINFPSPIKFTRGNAVYEVHTAEPITNYPHGPAVSLTYKSSRDDIWHIQTFLISKLPRTLQRAIKPEYNWESTGPGGCDSHCIESPCGPCRVSE